MPTYRELSVQNFFSRERVILEARLKKYKPGIEALAENGMSHYLAARDWLAQEKQKFHDDPPILYELEEIDQLLHNFGYYFFYTIGDVASPQSVAE